MNIFLLNTISGDLYLIAPQMIPYSTLFVLLDRNLVLINNKSRIYVQYLSVLTLCLLLVLYFLIVFMRFCDLDDDLYAKGVFLWHKLL